MSTADAATLLHAAELLESWASEFDSSGHSVDVELHRADLIDTAARLREMAG